jgi:hypothetical protein
MTSAPQALPKSQCAGIAPAQPLVSAGLLLVALLSPAVMAAQFQQPTDEELKMTSDPKAPGAAAVYLNIEEITNDPKHFQSYYVRIKVLQEKGKELATVEIPYWHEGTSVSNIEARTIHADGTVIPLTGSPEDLLITKIGDFQIGRKVFTLPSVEVGSILEYRYTLDHPEHIYSAPNWEIQKQYYVHQAKYLFTPFEGFLRNGFIFPSEGRLIDSNGIPSNTLIWRSKLPPGAKLIPDAIGRYKIEVTDIPPKPDEDFMPPIESTLYRVAFSYSNSEDVQNYWVLEDKLWSKGVDHFAEPTKTVRDAVNGLIAPGDSDLEKARKLYKAVQALDNTDFSRTKTQSELKQLKLKPVKRAEDTWNQKSGFSSEIVYLYLSMLRAAGLTAYGARVVDRQKGVFDPNFLFFDQLDTEVVILDTGGQEILLDPGQKMCPFQTLSWRHSGASGVRQSPDGHDAIRTPFQNYKSNSLTRIGDIAVDEHGSANGTIRFIITGQEALHWRQQALLNDLDEVKKQFDRSLESIVPAGVEAHIDHFLALDDPDANLMAFVNIKGTLGAATSRRLLLPGFFFQSSGHQPFIGRETRLVPVDMHFGEQVTDQVTYHTPPGFTVEGTPQDSKVAWQDHAVLVTKTVTAPGSVTVARTFGRAFTVIEPNEYQDLRGFYQKVAAADQQQLVLTVSAAQKGN